MNFKKNDFKKVFITGAGSGLGKMAAIALAKRGHEVFASVHYDSEIEEFKKMINLNKLNLHVFKLDVLNEKDRYMILDYNIDVFISNAAIGDSRFPWRGRC